VRGRAEDRCPWAAASRHLLHRLRTDCPEALSAPVVDLHRRWAADRGALDRLLIESLVLLDPFQVAGTGAAPFWTMFPVLPSAGRVASYLDRRAPFGVGDAMLFDHGADSAGLTGAAVWRELTGRGGQPGQLLGADARRFPADFAAFARYGPALRRLETAPHPPGPAHLGRGCRRCAREPQGRLGLPGVPSEMPGTA